MQEGKGGGRRRGKTWKDNTRVASSLPEEVHVPPPTQTRTRLFTLYYHVIYGWMRERYRRHLALCWNHVSFFIIIKLSLSKQIDNKMYQNDKRVNYFSPNFHV